MLFKKKDTNQAEASCFTAAKSSETAPTTLTSSTTVSTAVTLCTQICGPGHEIKTCAKTLLVDSCLESNPNVTKRIYVEIDDQSNVSFIDECLVDFFNVKFPKQSCKMSTAQKGCAIHAIGYLVSGLVLTGILVIHKLRCPSYYRVVDCLTLNMLQFLRLFVCMLIWLSMLLSFLSLISWLTLWFS